MITKGQTVASTCVSVVCIVIGWLESVQTEMAVLTVTFGFVVGLSTVGLHIKKWLKKD